MKSILIAAIALLSLPALGATNRLLILTDPTARGLAGKDFDRWTRVIVDEGNFPGGVIVREHPRWDRNWTNQNWAALNAMSNDVAIYQPTHIQIFGSLPMLVSGSHIDDGHEYRCRTSDNWLGCTNLVWTDTTNHTEMTGFDSGHQLNRNTVGDGRPDNDFGWFLRPVFRIDFAGVGTSAVDNTAWTSGCLNGTNKIDAADEGLWLRAYITNCIGYRTGAWTNTATGIVTGTLWVGGAGDAESKVATNFASHLSWTRSATAIAPGTARVYYDNWDAVENENLWDGSCNAPRALICFRYRSYMMEFWNVYAPGQRVIGMGWKTPNPPFLIYAWTKHVGQSGSGPDWVVGPSDVIVADFVGTSVGRVGTGKIDFGRPLLGDGTIPFSAKRPRGSLTVSGTLAFQ